MDKDRIEGAGKQVKGSVKEAIGKVTGNKQTEGEGAVEKNAGRVQAEVGKAKDAVRDTDDDLGRNLLAAHASNSSRRMKTSP